MINTTVPTSSTAKASFEASNAKKSVGTDNSQSSSQNSFASMLGKTLQGSKPQKVPTNAEAEKTELIKGTDSSATQGNAFILQSLLGMLQADVMMANDNNVNTGQMLVETSGNQLQSESALMKEVATLTATDEFGKLSTGQADKTLGNTVLITTENSQLEQADSDINNNVSTSKDGGLNGEQDRLANATTDTTEAPIAMTANKVIGEVANAEVFKKASDGTALEVISQKATQASSEKLNTVADGIEQSGTTIVKDAVKLDVDKATTGEAGLQMNTADMDKASTNIIVQAPIKKEPVKAENQVTNTVIKDNTANNQPVTINKGDMANNQPVTINKGDTANSQPVTVNKGDTANNQPVTVNKGDTTTSQPVTINKGDTTNSQPVTVIKGDTSQSNNSMLNNGEGTEQDSSNEKNGVKYKTITDIGLYSSRESGFVQISDVASQLGGAKAQVTHATQLSDNILANLQAGKSEFTMQLFPANLGKVSVKMVAENGMLTVELIADNPKTQSLLLSNSNEIKSLIQSSTALTTTVNAPTQNEQLQQNYTEQQGEGKQQQQQTQEQENQDSDQTDDFTAMFEFIKQTRINYQA